MWKVYKEHNGYIQGELVSKHSSESAALKAATKSIKFSFSEKQKKDKEITIWLDKIKEKGALDLSFNHLNKVSERAINISNKTDCKLSRIVSFVISSIITRITKNIKKFK